MRQEEPAVAFMAFSEEDLKHLERALIWYKSTHDTVTDKPELKLHSRAAAHTTALLARVRWMMK